jgi:hypothetical protein
MNKATCILRGVALACALCAAGTPAMAAKDPARWTQGDSTKAQRLATLKKEINAAYAEQQTACKHKASAKRDACLKQARQIYQRDMANAPTLLAQAPKGEVTERVVSTTPAPATSTQPGATAYGSSGAGATGSGGATGAVSGKDDAVPPSGSMQSQDQPQNQPQGSTPPVQQQ